MGDYLNKGRKSLKRHENYLEQGIILRWSFAYVLVVSHRPQLLSSLIGLLGYDLSDDSRSALFRTLTDRLDIIAKARMKCRQMKPVPYTTIMDALDPCYTDEEYTKSIMKMGTEYLESNYPSIRRNAVPDDELVAKISAVVKRLAERLSRAHPFDDIISELTSG